MVGIEIIAVQIVMFAVLVNFNVEKIMLVSGILIAGLILLVCVLSLLIPYDTINETNKKYKQIKKNKRIEVSYGRYKR